MYKRIKHIYLTTLSQKDYLWDKVIGRPIASVLIAVIMYLPLTPNQLTVASFFIAICSGFLFVFFQGYAGLILATIVLELAYLFDCADGQLARVNNLQSDLGHLLDSCVDAIKASLLVCAITIRLYLSTKNIFFLVLGILGLFVVEVSILLTEFSRRKEYLAQVTKIRPGVILSNRPRGILPWVRVRAENAGKFFIYYPAYIVLFSVLNRIDLFLYIFLATYTLYLFRIILSVGKAVVIP